MSTHNIICFYKLVAIIQISTHNICFYEHMSHKSSASTCISSKYALIREIFYSSNFEKCKCTVL